MLKKLYKSKLILYVVCIVLLYSIPINGNEVTNSEIDELMERILDSSNDILSSKANVTTATQLLAALPEPEEKVSIAVYHIADRTGQYRELGSSVVSQGATDMLITALFRSRQFNILGRMNFSDFMNEQNLQTSDRIRSGEGPIIGELKGADFIIEGAVTEYQVDKTTGGLGISIGGFGGTNKKALATTAIDIRLINTTTGEIIWADSLKGEIEGKRVGVQAFSFMGNNIVEFETGHGKQEVINLMIRTLLEEAVFKLANSNIF